ncbi:hypothetical protein [Kitasatospora sp. NPDC057595]
MGEVRPVDPGVGLYFPRDPEVALRGAIEHWSVPVNRRTLLPGAGSFAIGACTTPALRLARAAGDVEVAACTLATISLRAMLRGYPQEVIDMAQGAYDRARHRAAPRALAFIKPSARLLPRRAGAGSRTGTG